MGFALIALLAIWLTYVGFGSIALWAFRFAWIQFGARGTLMSRALPLLMLTVVVYFTGETVAALGPNIAKRLWQTVGFLSIVAIVFMVSTIRDEVLALREDRRRGEGPRPAAYENAAGDRYGHQPARTPLSLGEQVNVVAVMVVSQAIQVVLFTAGLFAFFLVLGIIAIPDDVTVLWAAEESCPVGEPPCAGTWSGIHIPIPQTVVHTSLFVAVLSGLYFTVSTSVDPLYRQRFFDPLIADVAVSLAGRDAYLELERERPLPTSRCTCARVIFSANAPLTRPGSTATEAANPRHVHRRGRSGDGVRARVAATVHPRPGRVAVEQQLSSARRDMNPPKHRNSGASRVFSKIGLS